MTLFLRHGSISSLILIGLLSGCSGTHTSENVPADFGASGEHLPVGFGPLAVFRAHTRGNELELTPIGAEQLESLGGDFLQFKSRMANGSAFNFIHTQGGAGCNANQYCTNFDLFNYSGATIDSGIL